MNQMLLFKIYRNPVNKNVLSFLELSNNQILNNSFEAWKSNGFDEGGCIFFDKYGINVPEEAKYTLGIHNIMVNETTGEIFAFHTGRFSIFFKSDFIKADIQNSDNLRRGYTFDCITDITILGNAWCFIDKFSNEAQQLQWSYEQTKKSKCDFCL